MSNTVTGMVSYFSKERLERHPHAKLVSDRDMFELDLYRGGNLRLHPSEINELMVAHLNPPFNLLPEHYTTYGAPHIFIFPAKDYSREFGNEFVKAAVKLNMGGSPKVNAFLRSEEFDIHQSALQIGHAFIGGGVQEHKIISVQAYCISEEVIRGLREGNLEALSQISE